MSAYIFYSLILSFLFGTGIALSFNIESKDFLIMIPLCICGVFLKDKPAKILLFLVIFGVSLAIWHTNIFMQKHDSVLSEKVGEKVSLIGKIDDEPDRRENLTIYRVHVTEYEERIRIFLPHYPAYKYGDEVELYGTLDKPENFSNENGIEFDYISFLEKDDIYTTMYQPKITFLKNNISVSGYLFSIKSWLMGNMQRWLPSPHAPLAAGLILGAKQSLGKDLLEKFRRVGLIHIVVLSGYNVTIIANTFTKIFSFLPRVFSFSFSIIAIIFFAIMTGASATIIRASVMAAIVLVAEYLGRRYAVNRALFLAAAVMVYLNPRILLFDPGFQLSFVATLALVHLGKRFENKLKFLPERFGIREITSSTLATQVAVLPLLISMTGEVSVVALIVNLLVLPTVPLAMLFGFIPSLIFFNAPILGLLASFPAYMLLSYEIWVVKIFAALPFAVWRF